MKRIKKTLSLFISFVVLFTACPSLQAEEFSTSLDSAELKQIMNNISVAVQPQIRPDNRYFGIPLTANEIRERYHQAAKIYEEDVANEAIDFEGENAEDYSQYFHELEEMAAARIKEDPRYDGFRSEEEKMKVAFYTVLLEQLDQLEESGKKESHAWRYVLAGGTLAAGATGAFFLFRAAHKFAKQAVYFRHFYHQEELNIHIFKYLSKKAWKRRILGGATLAVTGLLLVWELFVTPSVPYFSVSLTADELKEKFAEDPFNALSSFDRAATDFELVYAKSRACAQVLYDAVDIEYYTALNPSLENMKARIYIESIYWQDEGDHVGYLHQLATRLRNESNESQTTTSRED